MITIAHYVGPHASSPDWTPERQENATELLIRVNRLVELLKGEGIPLPNNPATGTMISGQTLGGFRPQNATQGAPKSTHKIGKGIDLYDPLNEIDYWCMQNLDKLEDIGLWLEHPSATKHWCHLQSVGPRSGRRVFYP